MCARRVQITDSGATLDGAAPVQIVGSERARRAWSRVLARRSVRATPSDDSPTPASHDGGESPTETQEVPASSLPPPPTVATASCRLKPGPGRERVLEPVCAEGVFQLLDGLGFTRRKCRQTRTPARRRIPSAAPSA